ncbi:rhomboid family intramembrane serine protease [Pseudomonadales bacterium]|nr:rhomboid family intramembrane serine protease [Pseudomonadales bacterium]
MIKILEAPLENNLHALSVYWWQKNFAHKIAEEAGVQVVWSNSQQHAEQMREDYQAFCDGRLQLTLEKVPQTTSLTAFLKPLIHVVAASPVTLLLVVLSVIGFLLVEFNVNSVVEFLKIQSVDNSRLPGALNMSRRISPEEFLAHGQYWRLVTPIFLHFGWMHITFNMLWLWELGRRIETQCGKVHFISVVFFIAVASNLYQAASTPYAYFGGMSGVIYGLLGYCAIFNLIAPHKIFELPRAIYIVMLLSLAVGWLGVFDFLANMANTAHLSGLIWGCFIALPSALLTRFFQRSESR